MRVGPYPGSTPSPARRGVWGCQARAVVPECRGTSRKSQLRWSANVLVGRSECCSAARFIDHPDRSNGAERRDVGSTSEHIPLLWLQARRRAEHIGDRSHHLRLVAGTTQSAHWVQFTTSCVCSNHASPPCAMSGTRTHSPPIQEESPDRYRADFVARGAMMGQPYEWQSSHARPLSRVIRSLLGFANSFTTNGNFWNEIDKSHLRTGVSVGPVDRARQRLASDVDREGNDLCPLRTDGQVEDPANCCVGLVECSAG